MVSAVSVSRAMTRFEPALRARVGVHVGIGHAAEPVQPVGFARGQAHQDRGAAHPLRQERRTRQGMRTAAGAAYDGKLTKSEGVGDRGDIHGGVGHPATGHAVRATVAGSVEADQPDA